MHNRAGIRKVFPIHTPSRQLHFPEKQLVVLENWKVFPMHLFPVHGWGGKVPPAQLET